MFLLKIVEENDVMVKGDERAYSQTGQHIMRLIMSWLSMAMEKTCETMENVKRNQQN